MNKGEGNGASPKTPPINISLRMATEDQQEWAFTTFLERDARAKEINELLDKLRTCAERQRWVAELRRVELEVEANTAKLGVVERAIDAKDEGDRMEWLKRGKRGEFERRGTEQANWDKMILEVDKLKTGIKLGRDRLKELQEKIGA